MTQTFTLSAAQRETLDRVGVLRLPGFFPAAEMAAMADALWADLERRFGIVRNRPETWTKLRPGQFQAVERAGAFSGLGSKAMLSLADSLLGAGAWEPPKRWGQPLVTFPAKVWDLQRVMWHLDYPATADRPGPLPALKLFTFLEPVAPHGGGTLYVAGSHRLAMETARARDRPIASSKVRQRLEADHAWFARLWAVPGDEVRALIGVDAQVRGVEVRVEEMTGDPGDLVVMHPAMLHGLAHNALDRPRMMLTQALMRKDQPFA